LQTTFFLAAGFGGDFAVVFAGVEVVVFVDEVDDFDPAIGMFANGFAFDEDVVEVLLVFSNNLAKGSDEFEVLEAPPKPELFDEEPKPEELVVVFVVVEVLEGGAPRAAKRLLRSIFLSVPISSLIPPFASSFFADEELLFGFDVSTMSFSQSSLGSEQDELLSLSENAISYFTLFCFSPALICAPISACRFFSTFGGQKNVHTRSLSSMKAGSPPKAMAKYSK